MQYLRSNRNRRSGNNNPSSAPSASTAEGLPEIPHPQLTRLRSFIQKVGITSFIKPRVNHTDQQPDYYNLESVDIDYHAELQNDVRTQRLE